MGNSFFLVINFKTLFYYLVFFLVIYFENTLVLGISFSIIWKLILVFYALTYVLYNKLINGLLIISFIFFLKTIFHVNFPYGFGEESKTAFFFLILPTFLIYFSNKYKHRPDYLKLFLIKVSAFFILSSLPFILNILESRGGSLDYMGFEGNKLIGIFKAVSISSKVYALSTVVIFNYYKEFKGKINKLIFLLLMTVGSIATLKTFGRLGWLILILGLTYIYFSKIGGFKFLTILVITALFVFYSFDYVESRFLNEDSTYFTKLTGSTSHKSNFSDLDVNVLSSGRLELFNNALNIFVSQDFLTQTFGVGKVKSMDLMFKIRGSYLTSHNRFLDVLLHTGYFGLAIFLFYIFKLKRYLFSSKVVEDKELLQFYLFMFIFTMLPSHGFDIYSEFIFVILIAYITNTINQKYDKNQISKR
jgi:hypothetical protein